MGILNNPALRPVREAAGDTREKAQKTVETYGQVLQENANLEKVEKVRQGGSISDEKRKTAVDKVKQTIDNDFRQVVKDAGIDPQNSDITPDASDYRKDIDFKEFLTDSAIRAGSSSIAPLAPGIGMIGQQGAEMVANGDNTVGEIGGAVDDTKEKVDKTVEDVQKSVDKTVKNVKKSLPGNLGNKLTVAAAALVLMLFLYLAKPLLEIGSNLSDK